MSSTYISPDSPVIQAIRADLDEQKAAILTDAENLSDLADSISRTLQVMSSSTAAALRSLDTDLQMVRNRLAQIEKHLGLTPPTEQQETSDEAASDLPSDSSPAIPLPGPGSNPGEPAGGT